MLADLERPGALTAGLNWYRANHHPKLELREREPPRLPTPILGVWSDGDAYLLEEQMAARRRSWTTGATSASRAPATGCNSTPRMR